MRNHLLNTWDILDPYYHKIRKFASIETDDKISVFRVHLIKYKGPTQILSDGNIILKGDLLIKIHLHNIKIIKLLQTITSSKQKTLLLYQMVKKALPKLAKYVNEHELRNKIKGICGVTMLNKLVGRLGFEIKPIPSLSYRILKYFSQLPIHYISTGLVAKRYEKRRVSYLFMSKNELLKLI
ncbi:hypothetical protein QA612_13150 [Evansella sp. AB-P1]|uniref:YkoP family protein n=1 Tax=Evansella sp. AB-P1 TaxID=3037653 RepID=UPI00241D336D|nr:hypothetical protein [Evansella sp. AB-P1]MDG5788430.1 hypothetical protein [Evansella sp. AB-P1]